MDSFSDVTIAMSVALPTFGLEVCDSSTLPSSLDARSAGHPRAARRNSDTPSGSAATSTIWNVRGSACLAAPSLASTPPYACQRVTVCPPLVGSPEEEAHEVKER